MTKYIDADRLRAEIERQKRALELSIQSQGDYGQSCHIVAYENILSLIDSLQQEQPIGEEYAIEIGKHTHTLRVGSQSDIDNLIRQEKQEQQEVDLDEGINRFWDSCIKHKNERGGNVIWSNKIEVGALARHFYELGLNARKEE